MAKRKTTQIEQEKTMSSLIQSFDKMFSEMKPKKHVAIFTHRMPDPDSMASAHAIKWILKKKYSVEARIFHEGVVSHQQNKTMANILEISLEPVTEFNPEKFERVIIVDATTENTPLEQADVVIDHHRVNENNAEIIMIEPVGAAATLVYELIKELEVPIEDDTDNKMATGLFFGIRNDTAELVSDTSTDRDYKATLELISYIDRPKLTAVVQYPLPTYFFEAERTVNTDGNFEIHQSFFVGTLGVITQSKRDALPMVADKMVRMQGIETAVIFAVVDDNLEASVRSRNASLDVNAFCKKVFGKDFSGGKLGSGAALVPMGILGPSDLPDDLQQEWWNNQKKVLFYKIQHVAGVS